MSNKDLVVQYSDVISAYMSGLPNVNLAYVKYFGKQPEAIKATFKSLDAYGFTLEYETLDQQDLIMTISWPETCSPPLTKREQIRPILEDMAKIAEEALGMPTSLNGPPPIQAMMRAMQAEQQLSETIKKKDEFLEADLHWQVMIILGMALTYYLTIPLPPSSSFFYLLQEHWVGIQTIQWIWKLAVFLHISEALFALGLCYYRGWYSLKNIIKWTFSTFFFGVASLSKLLHHHDRLE
ncbi:hypothetical protein BJ944DRAFT_274110 [Cunninghamella echinulata]|nr:hypothetical protein BJ944DRAFT_274110 [Cunninghamella echinulata]